MKWKRRFIKFVQPGQAANYPSILRQFIRFAGSLLPKPIWDDTSIATNAARTIAARYAEKKDSHPLNISLRNS
jgi:hypothetical protein